MGERERTTETETGLMLVRRGEKSVGEMVVVLLEKGEGKNKKEVMKGDQRVQDGAGATFRGEDEGMTGELI